VISGVFELETESRNYCVREVSKENENKNALEVENA